jgi:Zn-finger nucleic acid-binding protein
MGMPKEEKELDLACPKCSVSMTPVNYVMQSGVIIDRCPSELGLWSDKGNSRRFNSTENTMKIRITHKIMLSKTYHPFELQIHTCASTPGRHKAAITFVDFISNLFTL